MSATATGPIERVSPNGWRLSGEGGEADRVRCSRGLGAGLSTILLDRNAKAPLAFVQHAEITGQNAGTESPQDFCLAWNVVWDDRHWANYFLDKLVQPKAVAKPPPPGFPVWIGPATSRMEVNRVRRL